MVNTSDLINTIKEFEEKVPTRALYYFDRVQIYPPDPNDKANLNYASNAVAKLRELLNSSKDGQVNIIDYSQLQDFMTANYTLQYITKLKTYAEVVEADTLKKNLYYATLIKVFETWRNKENYIVIPQEIENQALLKAKNYINAYNKLPPEQKAKVTPFLKSIIDVKGMYKFMVKNNDNLINLMINKWNKDHQNKGDYIKNTYIKFKEVAAVFGLDQLVAVDRLFRWQANDYDPKYVINLNDWDKEFAKIIAVKNANEEAKKFAQKKQEAEKLKAVDADMKASVKQAQDPEIATDAKQKMLLDTYEEMMHSGDTVITQLETDAAKYDALIAALNDLPEPPTEDQVKDMKTQIDQAFERVEQASAQRQDIYNQLTTKA